VVPAAGHELEQDALDALARSQLAGYKVPRRYVALPALPRNAYGKVVKRELRETLAQQVR
jgi:long-chain acyl-CoA synthetase